MIVRISAAALLTGIMTIPTHAHVGHIGELAGHSHWVGIAAVAGAAIIAGVIAAKDRKKAKEDSKEAEVESEETAGENA